MKETPFETELKDPTKVISINGKMQPRALYNLVVSKRDLGLWRAGMKPTIGWTVTPVKKYFGLKGNDRQKLYQDICDLVSKHLKN